MMCKSDILNNKEDYIKWMFDCNFWTNKNYKPTTSDLPLENEYPCVAIGMRTQNYRGRDENYIEIVSLKDFGGASVFRVVQTTNYIGMFGEDDSEDKEFGIFTSQEEVNYATKYADDNVTFYTSEIKLNEAQT